MTQTPRQGCTVLPDINPCPQPPCLARLSLAQPSLSQNGGLRRPARKHAYKSPVCIAPEGSSVPTPRSSRERALKDDRLSWGGGNLSLPTGVSVVAQHLRICTVIVLDCVNAQASMND